MNRLIFFSRVKLIVAILKLKIDLVLPKKITKEYNIDEWCIKLRNNLVLHKEAYLNLITKLLFLKN